MRNIKRIFIHCTAGPQNQSIETIKNYWKNVRKWKNVGYHYIIKADGEVVQLLDESKSSNGVAGYNSTSINVCYIGGIDGKGNAIDNRTEAQKASLITLLKDLKKRYPDAEILGHREIWGFDKSKWKKMCPCFPAKAEYAWIGKEEPKVEKVKEEPKPVVEEPKESIKEAPKVVKEEAKKPVNPVTKAKQSLLSKLMKAIFKL